MKFDRASIDRALVAHFDRLRVHPLAKNARFSVELGRSERGREGECHCFEPSSELRIQRIRVVYQDMSVAPTDPSGAEREESLGQIMQQGATIGNERFGGSLRNAKRTGELRDKYAVSANFRAPAASL